MTSQDESKRKSQIQEKQNNLSLYHQKLISIVEPEITISQMIDYVLDKD